MTGPKKKNEKIQKNPNIFDFFEFIWRFPQYFRYFFMPPILANLFEDFPNIFVIFLSKKVIWGFSYFFFQFSFFLQKKKQKKTTNIGKIFEYISWEKKTENIKKILKHIKKTKILDFFVFPLGESSHTSTNHLTRPTKLLGALRENLFGGKVRYRRRNTHHRYIQRRPGLPVAVCVKTHTKSLLLLGFEFITCSNVSLGSNPSRKA